MKLLLILVILVNPSNRAATLEMNVAVVTRKEVTEVLPQGITAVTNLEIDEAEIIAEALLHREQVLQTLMAEAKSLDAVIAGILKYHIGLGIVPNL